MNERFYAALTGAGPQDADPSERRNAVIHMISLTLYKVADGLIDPKLVLAWLLGALGVPGAAIGALVPVREAGALLPQLALAQVVSARPTRKWVWATGAALQGIAALAMAGVTTLLAGAAAGWAVLALLAGLSVARAAASVSHKDALARTIPKSRRGAVSGVAASVAPLGVLGFGICLWADVIPTSATAIAAVIALAGVLLIAAAAVFAALREQPREPGSEESGVSPSAMLAPVIDDAQLRRLIAARALLAVTALAPPFIVMLSAEEGRDTLSDLGPLVLASAVASLVSGYVWGRLSDRSSRLTLILAGAMGAAVFVVAGAVGLSQGGLGSWATAALAVFAGQIAYEGVRAGRKLHLTDMAPDARRARYTAVSNTLVGLALLAGGAFGVMADAYGAATVLMLFAVIAAAGSVVAAGLKEVQAT